MMKILSENTFRKYFQKILSENTFRKHFVLFNCLLAAVVVCSCSKDLSTVKTEETEENETMLLADNGFYSALSKNFCSFLDVAMSRGDVNDQESLNAIARETVNEIKPLFVQTRSNQELDAFLNSNWDLNAAQNRAISLLSGIIMTADFDFEASAQSCAEIIADLPEDDRAPVLYYYHIVKGLCEQFCSVQTKSDDYSFRDNCYNLALSALGTIHGAALGTFLAETTGSALLGAAVGAAAGALLPIAMGYMISRLLNRVLIQGVVVDGNGSRISNAYVEVSGKSIGTTTEPDGSFSLKVPENSIVVIYVNGFKPTFIDTNKMDGYQGSIVLEYEDGYNCGELPN